MTSLRDGDRDRALGSTNDRRQLAWIVLIVLAAFIVRLYLVTGDMSWTPQTAHTATEGYLVRGMQLSGQPGPMYDQVARNFIAGHGLVNEPGSAYHTRAPLYPLLLASIYVLFEEPLLPVGVVHAILGALACLLVWKATRLISTGRSALLAAGIVAFMPEFLKYTPRLYASSLLVFLSAAFFLAAFVSIRRHSAWWSMVPGAILGLMALTRLELIVILPAAMLWQLIDRGKPARQRVVRCSLLTLGFMLLVAPWLAYNQATDVEGLARAGGGELGQWLWMHHGPHSMPVWEDPPTGPFAEGRGRGAVPKIEARKKLEEELGTSDPSVLDPYFKREALQFMVENPLRNVMLTLSGIMMTWNLWPTPPPPLAAFIAFWAFLAVSIYGVVVNWRRPETHLIVLVVLAITLFYGFIHGHPRYRLPATIPTIMMFAVGATYLLNRVRAARAHERVGDGVTRREAVS